MKYNILKGFLLVPSLLVMACTANYLDINFNPYEVTKEQMQADDYAVMAALSSMAATVISSDINTAQFTECLLGGPMGGYYATSNNGFAYTIDHYNATDDWTRVLLASDNIIPKLYGAIEELEGVSESPVAMAISQINKVAAMHRVTDTYGPIPYSEIGIGGKIQVPYDSQEEVYTRMFEELDEAIEALADNLESSVSPKADYVYGGSPLKWCQFANSLKLRLAMRIVYADREKAKQMAESAVSHPLGVLTTNDDNAKLTKFGSEGNPVYVAVKYNEQTNSNTGGDTHVAADIVCYMNGYEDPRRQYYFINSEWENIPYVGMRRGLEIPPLGTVGRKYSGVNISRNTPLYWMTAAEVAFLRAEAAAVFNFDMGGNAGDFYNEGTRLSFEQWGAAGYADYVTDATRTPQNYTDPAGTNSYSDILSNITVAWDDSATPEQKQERIIIQKWIANFNLGNEAWADFRRTGYPKLMPVPSNKSGGIIVNAEMGARRMPYPQAEYTNNSENINIAVSQYLKGPDNMATRVWWDCNPSIN